MTDEKAAPKAEKPIKAPSKKAPKPDLAADIASLRSRIEDLERNQKVIVDGYEFAANEVRPLFGFGAIAVIFDAIHKKLSK